jgi:hypothetical protein
MEAIHFLLCSYGFRVLVVSEFYAVMTVFTHVSLREYLGGCLAHSGPSCEGAGIAYRSPFEYLNRDDRGHALMYSAEERPAYES